MEQSAASRDIPVEIWTFILKIAIKAFIGSYDNDNIAQDLKLFRTGCGSAQEFIESEINRTTLRLVCRSWNMALKSEGYKLTIWHLLPKEAPMWTSKIFAVPSHRTEFPFMLSSWSHTLCSCLYKPCPTVYRLIKQQKSLELQNGNNLRGNLDQLEALLLHDSFMKFENLPFQAPRLRLLSWAFYDMDSISYRTSLTFSCLELLLKSSKPLGER